MAHCCSTSNHFNKFYLQILGLDKQIDFKLERFSQKCEVFKVIWIDFKYRLITEIEVSKYDVI